MSDRVHSDRTEFEEFYPGYSAETFPDPGHRPGRGPSRSTIVLLVSGALVLAAVVAICLPFLTRDDKPVAVLGTRPTSSTTVADATTSAPAAAGAYPSAKEAGAAFLGFWAAGDYARMQPMVTPDTPNLSTVYGTMDGRLGVTRRTIVAGPIDAYGNQTYRATLALKDFGDLTWTGSVALVQGGGGWLVDWHTDAIHPELAVGQRLELGEGGAARGELLDRKGRPLASNDQLRGKVVGSVSDDGSATGLQRDQAGKLAGRSAKAVVIVNSGTGAVVRTLLTAPGAAKGTAVRTTLDLDYQAAAEAALAGVSSRAALVAMDTRTGSVLALADVNGGGLPASLLAQEAPGSTFKIVTATAALSHGATPATKVSCPKTLSVNGKSFKNHEPSPSRELSLTEAFADSCNTAFISLEQDLPDGALLAAAERYGFGIDKPLPVASSGGHIPAPDGPVEAAADAIGQGRVAASPLQMASVAAGVASGTWHQPRLLTSCDCASHPVPHAADLRRMMRAVVTSGTGTVMRGTPGGSVYAKTGTAEFGTGEDVHAWFVGWQGTVAFAAYVEVGKTGGETAAPLVRKFLTRLAR